MNREAAFSQRQGGGHTSHATADDQGRMLNRYLECRPRLQKSGPSHGHAQ